MNCFHNLKSHLNLTAVASGLLYEASEPRNFSLLNCTVTWSKMASWEFEPNALAQALQDLIVELRTDSLTTGNKFIVIVKKTKTKQQTHS